MTDLVRRFLAAHATVMNTARAEPYPDVFEGSAALVTEIDDALSEARSQVNKLKASRHERSLDAMSAATTQAEMLLRQSLAMVGSLRNVLEFHKGRRNGCGND